MEEKVLLASEKQLEAIKCFFDNGTEDILYGWAARWGKSEAIGMMLAICISAFPWSSWLIARTVLADLKATSLNTFFKVIKRFGYGEQSYRDKIRDERHIEFVNWSRLYVIQVNLEPNDIEFDRIWSYGYTGGFLDEGQQMSNKVKEVLQWRLSELDGFFSTEVPIEYDNYSNDQLNPWYQIKFKIVGQTVRKSEDRTIPEEDIIEEIIDWGKICYIIREEILTIPYRLVKSEKIGKKLIHTYAWSYKWCIFTGCNPWTNFTRTEFYKPWKNNTLPSYMKFIPAKVWDNPWIDPSYIERLERLPESSIRKQRLLYGNFDFDDNPGLLYDQNTIEKMYDRPYEWDKTLYITVDAARQGKDSTEIGLWEWLHLKEIIRIEQSDLVSQAERIEDLINKYWVDIDNVIVDEVWVWGWLVDMLGCKGFVGNSQPLHPYAAKLLSYKKRNYLNLRTQSFYYLQRYMKHITITCDHDTRDRITEELLTVKEKDVTNDSKLQIIPKSLMKEELGRSPDLADMISMRMWWLIKWHHEWLEDDIIEDNATPKEETVASFIQWLIDEQEKSNMRNSFEPDLDIY